MCVSVSLVVCMCSGYVPDAQGGQKRVSHALKLHLGAEN